MKRALRVAVFLGGIVACSDFPAHAETLEGQLMPEEIAAAARSARARLSAVDAKARAGCDAEYKAAAEQAPSALAARSLAAAAACFRNAGALDAAIRSWRELVEKYPKDEVSVDALDVLGTAYESIGDFVEAARAHAWFASMHPVGSHSRDKLVRAICMRRQLGLETSAALHELERRQKVVAIAALCENVHPIESATAARGGGGLRP
jgi:TolA-binding protein